MKKHPLQHFEIFLIVCELKSFTATAKQLNITKAAVSQIIRNLENALKTPLFIRTTRSMTLTTEGELLKKQCERIKAEIDLAQDLMTGFHEEPTGVLRISCNPYYKNKLLINTLQKYHAKYPEVFIELMSEERMPDMLKENIDIVFGVNWEPPLDVVARPVGTTRYILCASPLYLKHNGTPNSIEDLKNFHYIPHLGRSDANIINALKTPSLPTLDSYLAMNDANLMRQAALNHMGIIQVHDYMVEKDIRDGRLTEILPDAFTNETKINMYYQKHRFVQPKIKHFVHLILDAIQPTN